MLKETKRGRIDPELLRENEIEVNRQTKKLIYFLGFIGLFGCIFTLITDSSKYLKLDLLNSIFLGLAFVVMFLVNIFVSEENRYYKYIFLSWLYIPILVEVVLTTDYFWLAFVLPIMLAGRYYNLKLIHIVSVVTQLMLVVANAGIAFVQPYFGYARAGSVMLEEGTTLVGDGRWLSEYAAELLQNGTVEKLEYMRVNYWTHVAYYAIFLLCISGCALLITRHGIHVMEKQSRALEEKRKADVSIAESRYRIMISQMQPHFVFNVLATISGACDEDPAVAKQMLSQFAEFLRHDIDVLSSDRMIPFEREIKSVENYISLEKIRFEDHLNVVWEIGPKDFLLPPLSIQPLVENAVQHGVTKKIGAGTIWIRTKEGADHILIEIEDDGAGFDPNVIQDDGRSHVGLENVKKRLKTLIDADLLVESEPGKGTKITITVPKMKG